MKTAHHTVPLDISGEWEVQRSRKDKKLKPKKEEEAAWIEETIKKVEAVSEERSKAAEEVEPESASAAGETKTKKKKKPSKVSLFGITVVL